MAPSETKDSTTETRRGPLPDEANPSSAADQSTDPTQRHAMIAEAAFFIAQARGFAPHQELDDWLAAEREVEQRLSSIDL